MFRLAKVEISNKQSEQRGSMLQNNRSTLCVINVDMMVWNARKRKEITRYMQVTTQKTRYIAAQQHRLHRKSGGNFFFYSFPAFVFNFTSVLSSGVHRTSDSHRFLQVEDTMKISRCVRFIGEQRKKNNVLTLNGSSTERNTCKFSRKKWQRQGEEEEDEARKKK